MPPKCKFTREDIVKTALDITKEEGLSAVTARAVGARLNSSPKVIFSLFKNMEELQMQIIQAADRLYQQYIREDMEKGEYPPYKACGMAYIRFATEEKELFKLLFMRDRSSEVISENKDEIKFIIETIMKNTGLDEEKAYLFHLESWVYVHGIASMIATSYLRWEPDFINRALTHCYTGLKYCYCREEEHGAGAED